VAKRQSCVNDHEGGEKDSDVQLAVDTRWAPDPRKPSPTQGQQQKQEREAQIPIADHSLDELTPPDQCRQRQAGKGGAFQGRRDQGPDHPSHRCPSVQARDGWSHAFARLGD
jgi:hypothetical protein